MSLAACRHCGASVSPDAILCPSCGAPSPVPNKTNRLLGAWFGLALLPWIGCFGVLVLIFLLALFGFGS